MFHQPNLHAYDGEHSLLSDLFDAVLAQYNEFFGDVPLLSLSMRTIGERMMKRARYDQTRIDASLVIGSGLILVADRDIDAPLTGVRMYGADEQYGGQTIASVALKADVVRSIPMADLVGYNRPVT
jgi:glycine cleavage system pyridoxal-binding protein P